MRKEILGKVIMDLAPSKERNNPRNSEGAFYQISDREIIFAYTRFKGNSTEDHSPADLVMLRSTDGGESFQEDGVITTCREEGGITWGERVLCTTAPCDAYFVVNNDRVTRLSDGRIIIPAAIHAVGWEGSTESGELYADGGEAVLFVSPRIRCCSHTVPEAQTKADVWYGRGFGAFP